METTAAKPATWTAAVFI